MTSSLYFSDNFFSAGTTKVYNEQKEEVGSIDLKSAFSSSLDVYDQTGKIVVRGKFPFMSNKWLITNDAEEEVGRLKQRFSFFSKKLEYTNFRHGSYLIESEAFSKEYDIRNSKNDLVATFKKVSGFFESAAFKLENFADELLDEELVAVVMGVHMINKRNDSSAATSASIT